MPLCGAANGAQARYLAKDRLAHLLGMWDSITADLTDLGGRGDGQVTIIEQAPQGPLPDVDVLYPVDGSLLARLVKEGALRVGYASRRDHKVVVTPVNPAPRKRQDV